MPQIQMTERDIVLARVALLQRCDRLRAKLARPECMFRAELQASYDDSIALLNALYQARMAPLDTAEPRVEAV